MAIYRRRRTYGRPALGRRRRAVRSRRATRPYRRSAPMRTRRTRVRIPGYVQPDYTLVRMKDRNVFTTSAGTVPTVAGHTSSIDFQIHGSDIFDAFALIPSALSTQPTGFNQWMTFYNRFLVHRSGIQVTPIAIKPTDSAPTQLPFMIIITPVTINTLTSSNVSFEEQPYSRAKTYSGGQAFVSGVSAPSSVSSPGQQRLVSVSNSIMTKKIAGVKDLSDDDNYKGSATASPNDMFYWQVSIVSLVPWDGVSPVANYTLDPYIIQARMFYSVQLLDRNTIPDSGVDPEEP